MCVSIKKFKKTICFSLWRLVLTYIPGMSFSSQISPFLDVIVREIVYNYKCLSQWKAERKTNYLNRSFWLAELLHKCRHSFVIIRIARYVRIFVFKGTSTSQVICARNEMMMDEYDGQMIFGDLVGLKLPDIRLTGEEKPLKNLTQETCPDQGSNLGPLRDKHACYHLFHSGGPG